MSVLSKPYFHNEEAAFAYLEGVIWPEGPTCPHCGATDRISSIKPNPEKRVRIGLKKCGHCKGQFTVKVGTVFEHIRLPLHKALQAVYLLTSSKKGGKTISTVKKSNSLNNIVVLRIRGFNPTVVLSMAAISRHRSSSFSRMVVPYRSNNTHPRQGIT